MSGAKPVFLYQWNPSVSRAGHGADLKPGEYNDVHVL